METEPCGLDDRILRNIQFTARNLAYRQAVPGMDAADFEQDLALDLLYRSRAFDRTRSSFRTFADRIVRHRVATLTAATRRLAAERSLLSLDGPIAQESGCECRPPLYVDEMALTEDTIALRIDIHRLVESLPPTLVEGCQILLAGTVSEGAREAGIHRSTAYERIRQLREHAASGLAAYAQSDSLDEQPVSGGDHQRPQRQANGMAFGCRSESRLFVTERRLRHWIDDADPGEILEYYRGALWLESSAQGSRLPERERIELVRVAEAVRRASDQGQVLLLQRRHGDCDYSYLAVHRNGPGPKGSRPCPARPDGRRP